nr:hypothetical protein [Lachnospiraceae bacterium]
KIETLAKYIYEQRCKIAHYRYMHEPIKDSVTLKASSLCLLKLVKSIFEELDSSIITINEDNEVWKEMVTSCGN